MAATYSGWKPRSWHQLNVLGQRAPNRPQLRWVDRVLFVWLYRCCPRILDAITIVRPETVVRWHRMGLPIGDGSPVRSEAASGSPGGYAPSVQQALSARSCGGLAAAWARGVQAGSPARRDCVLGGSAASVGKAECTKQDVESFRSELTSSGYDCARGRARRCPNRNSGQPERPKAPPQLQELEAAGRELGVTVVVADAHSPDDLDSAFRTLAAHRIDVMVGFKPRCCSASAKELHRSPPRHGSCRLSGTCRRRRADQLWSRSSRVLSPRRLLCA